MPTFQHSSPLIPPRPFLLLLSVLLLPLTLVAASTRSTTETYRLSLDTLSEGFDYATCWVHARAGVVPGPTPAVVLTLQKLQLTGNDVFFALNEMRSDDLGATWSDPVEHATTLGRRDAGNGIQVGVSDYWPKWHAPSGKLLGIGHTVHYTGDKIAHDAPRATAYSIYDPKEKTWTPWATLAADDPDLNFNAGAGCSQRIDLPNGDILLPVYFRRRGEKVLHSVVLRCAFDGKTLRIIERGNALSVPIDRGLYEPSLTIFKGRYYLTLRNDRAGYVATSSDGLHFSKPVIWTWDDGSELGNYNTQTHWVAHSDRLYLAYTRKGANNDHVFRHRAPLFLAQVDPEALTIIKSSERILVPNRGARLGNFGVTEVSEKETWVTVTEWMQTWGPNPSDYTIPMKYGSNNAVFAARIHWSEPNTTWNAH